MATIYFLLFIAASVVVLVWATRRSKEKTELAARRRHKYRKAASEKLVTPADTILSHSDEIWQKRRKHASHAPVSAPKFVPKSMAEQVPVYDGYSRRDRHHITPEVQVKEEAHAEDLQMSSIEYKPDKSKAPSQRIH